MGLFSSIGRALSPVTNVIESITPWNDKTEGIIPINHLTPWNDNTTGGKIANIALIAALGYGAMQYFSQPSLAAQYGLEAPISTTEGLGAAYAQQAGYTGAMSGSGGVSLSGLAESQAALSNTAALAESQAALSTAATSSQYASLSAPHFAVSPLTYSYNALPATTSGLSSVEAAATIPTLSVPASTLSYPPYPYSSGAQYLSGITPSATSGPSGLGLTANSGGLWEWMKANPIVPTALGAGAITGVGGYLGSREMAKAQKYATDEQARQFNLLHNYGGSFGEGGQQMLFPRAGIEQHQPQTAVDANTVLQRVKYDPAYRKGFETAAAKLIDPNTALALINATKRFT